MNRREAIAALTALPAVARIAKVDLAPNAVIVVESDEYLSFAARCRIEESIRQAWPNHRVVVMDGGMRLSIVESK